MAETVGAWLRERREARGWSQVDLAERAEVNSSTVSRLEAGELVGRSRTLVALAEAFDEPADGLLLLAGHLKAAERWRARQQPDTTSPVAEVKRALGRTPLRPAVRGALTTLVQELANANAAEWARRFDAAVADALPSIGVRIVGRADATPEHVEQVRQDLARAIRERLFGTPQ